MIWNFQVKSIDISIDIGNTDPVITGLLVIETNKHLGYFW